MNSLVRCDCLRHILSGDHLTCAGWCRFYEPDALHGLLMRPISGTTVLCHKKGEKSTRFGKILVVASRSGVVRRPQFFLSPIVASRMSQIGGRNPSFRQLRPPKRAKSEAAIPLFASCGLPSEPNRRPQSLFSLVVASQASQNRRPQFFLSPIVASRVSKTGCHNQLANPIARFFGIAPASGTSMSSASSETSMRSVSLAGSIDIMRMAWFILESSMTLRTKRPLPKSG